MTEYKLLLLEIWYYATVAVLILSLWRTESGQFVNVPLAALAGCMALAGCALYPRPRWIK